MIKSSIAIATVLMGISVGAIAHETDFVQTVHIYNGEPYTVDIKGGGQDNAGGIGPTVTIAPGQSETIYFRGMESVFASTKFLKGIDVYNADNGNKIDNFEIAVNHGIDNKAPDSNIYQPWAQSYKYADEASIAHLIAGFDLNDFVPISLNTFAFSTESVILLSDNNQYGDIAQDLNDLISKYNTTDPQALENYALNDPSHDQATDNIVSWYAAVMFDTIPGDIKNDIRSAKSSADIESVISNCAQAASASMPESDVDGIINGIGQSLDTTLSMLGIVGGGSNDFTPAGSYHCANVKFDSGSFTLSATCHDANGSLVDSQLNYLQCLGGKYNGQVENDNGHLACTAA